MCTEEYKLAQTLSTFHSDVLCCAISPSSSSTNQNSPQYLAVGCSDKSLRVFSLVSGDGSDHVTRPRRRFVEITSSATNSVNVLKGHEYPITCCAFSTNKTNGRLLLVTCSQDGKAILWLPPNFEKICIFEHPSTASMRICRFSPDSYLLATGSDDETVCLWDLPSKELIAQLTNFEDSVVALDFSPDSKLLATGTTLGDLRIWLVKSRDQWATTNQKAADLGLLEKEAHDLGVTCCRFKPDAVDPETTKISSSIFLLATAGNDNLIKLWNVNFNAINGNSSRITLDIVVTLNRHSSNVMCLDFSPDGALLASGSGDKLLILWDVNKRTCLKELHFHTSYVTCCSFSDDGHFLISGSNDKRVAVWQNAKFDDHVDLIDLEIFVPSDNIEQSTKFLDGSVLVYNDVKYANFSNVEQIDQFNLCQKNRSKIPNEFLCPITREIMRDPVVASDGFTYERAAIKAWLDQGRRTSPMTNTNLPNLDLTSNLALKILIHSHSLSTTKTFE